MLPWLSSLISATLEYQHWGLNALTISFFLSGALTLISAWGLILQQRTIFRHKQAEVVSVFWLTYYAALQLAILLYGLSIYSAALIINGLLAAFYLPILVGLWRFKGFSLKEKALGILLVTALLVMALLPLKSAFFLAFAVGGLISAITQPLEMWQKKSAQGLNINLIYTLLLGNIIWLTYGAAVSDWILIVINSIAFCIFGTTVLLWKRYTSTT